MIKMNVKELIKELKKFNKEARVGTPDYYGSCEEIESVSESMWDNTDGTPKDVILR